MKKGKGDRASKRAAMRRRRQRDLHHEEGGDGGDDELDAEPRLAGKALVALFRHLEIIVVKADGAKAERHHQHGDHIDVGQIGPKQRAAEDTGQNHQPAHGRRTGLLEMRLRPVGTDRLALALANPQRIDDRRSEQKHDKGRGEQRRTRPEGDVPEQVEDLNFIRQFNEPDQHICPFARRSKRRDRLGDKIPATSCCICWSVGFGAPAFIPVL